MKTLEPQRNIIECEAEDHATETRYAVTHNGKELHPSPKTKKSKVHHGKSAHRPWQID